MGASMRYQYAIVQDDNDFDWDALRFRDLVHALTALESYRCDYPDAHIVVLDMLLDNYPVCVNILKEV